ncbi:uncharacterized protein CDAR_519011 [Caerostris darwini]|uniref:Uncharacterized protein n=1 Tax=Caerostris darwini TaxID=1538125 RepID=A0AAV4PNQ5_9ARAC|nr:uncharacterized protein CDAR_519011 [Caerostris darwini]
MPGAKSSEDSGCLFMESRRYPTLNHRLFFSIVHRRLFYEDVAHEYRRQSKGKSLEIIITQTDERGNITLIPPVGSEILKWKYFHDEFLNKKLFEFFLTRKLCWTSLGTIDYKKTAELLVRGPELDLVKRYKLACVYCLRDDIQSLWESLSEKDQNLFYNEEDANKVGQQTLIVLWTYIIKGEERKLNNLIKADENNFTLNQYAFKFAALTGNKIATKYFFQRLTFEEREKCLLRIAQNVAYKRTTCTVMYCFNSEFHRRCFSDVLGYLLNRLNREQQRQIFQNHAYQILSCFQDWPWQDLFLQTAEHMWNFLSEGYHYSILLDRLIENRDKCGYKYQEIFGKYWLQSPSTFKDYMINRQCSISGFLFDLFKFEDIENIKLVLRDASAFDKERLISSSTGVRMCHKFIIRDQWPLLQLFIQECMLSSEAVVKLKQGFEEFLKSIYRIGQIKWRKGKWDRFYQILDDPGMVISTMQVDESKAKYSNKRKRAKRITMKKRSKRRKQQ